MVFAAPGQPLALTELANPHPGEGQVLIRVAACAVCRTDLHIVDGDLTRPKPALVPGHEIVGVITQTGIGADRFAVGDRVGLQFMEEGLHLLPADGQGGPLQ